MKITRIKKTNAVIVPPVILLKEAQNAEDNLEAKGMSQMWWRYID